MPNLSKILCKDAVRTLAIKFTIVMVMREDKALMSNI